MALSAVVNSHFGTRPALAKEPGFFINSVSWSAVTLVSSNISADYVVGTGIDLTAPDYSNGGAFDLQLTQNCPFGGVLQVVFAPGSGTPRGPFMSQFFFHASNPLKCYLRMWTITGGAAVEMIPGTDILNGDNIAMFLKFIQD